MAFLTRNKFNLISQGLRSQVVCSLQFLASSSDRIDALSGHRCPKSRTWQRPDTTKIDDKWTAMGQRLGPNDKQPGLPRPNPPPPRLYLSLTMSTAVSLSQRPRGTLSALTAVGRLPLIYDGINITARVFISLFFFVKPSPLFLIFEPFSYFLHASGVHVDF